MAQVPTSAERRAGDTPSDRIEEHGGAEQAPRGLRSGGGPLARKRERIVSHTVEELQDMYARGESLSDWSALDAMSEEELEAAIASDPDEAGLEFDWSRPLATPPRP
jgi:hypothetical protein